MNQEERGLGDQNLDRGKDAVCNEKAGVKTSFGKGTGDRCFLTFIEVALVIRII